MEDEQAKKQLLEGRDEEDIYGFFVERIRKAWDRTTFGPFSDTALNAMCREVFRQLPATVLSKLITAYTAGKVLQACHESKWIVRRDSLTLAKRKYEGKGRTEDTDTDSDTESNTSEDAGKGSSARARSKKCPRRGPKKD